MQGWGKRKKRKCRQTAAANARCCCWWLHARRQVDAMPQHMLVFDAEARDCTLLRHIETETHRYQLQAAQAQRQRLLAKAWPAQSCSTRIRCLAEHGHPSRQKCRAQPDQQTLQKLYGWRFSPMLAVRSGGWWRISWHFKPTNPSTHTRTHKREEKRGGRSGRKGTRVGTGGREDKQLRSHTSETSSLLLC